MTSGDDLATTTLLVVNNVAGGKESHVDVAGRHGAYGELVALIDDTPLGRTRAVLCLQEATTAEAGLPTTVTELEALGVDTSYVARMSTSWYPVGAKWSRRGIASDTRSSSEGLCVGVASGGLLLERWGMVAGLPDANSLSMVLDLPLVTFDAAQDAESSFSSTILHAEWRRENDPPVRIQFRHNYYHGNRDSDPRVAQACLVGATSGGSGEREDLYVLVNVHLSTIREERASAGSEKPNRKTSNKAQFLRHLQLAVIAEFVRDVRRSLNLPVVVAGDLNAEPDSPEVREFCRSAGMEPVLGGYACWRCGVVQIERPPVAFYRSRDGGFGLTMEPNKPDETPVLVTDAVCSNDECLEPRFTHKVTGLLVDNVLISRPSPQDRTRIEPGVPTLALSPGYTDHAVLSVPLRVIRTESQRGSVA